MCALGDEGVFIHQDPEACDPEGIHGQQYSRWENPEAELWDPHRQQRHTGCKSVHMLKETIMCSWEDNISCTDGTAILTCLFFSVGLDQDLIRGIVHQKIKVHSLSTRH